MDTNALDTDPLVAGVASRRLVRLRRATRPPARRTWGQPVSGGDSPAAPWSGKRRSNGPLEHARSPRDNHRYRASFARRNPPSLAPPETSPDHHRRQSAGAKWDRIDARLSPLKSMALPRVKQLMGVPGLGTVLSTNWVDHSVLPAKPEWQTLNGRLPFLVMKRRI